MTIEKIGKDHYTKEVTVKEKRFFNKSSLEQEKIRTQAQLKEIEKDLEEITKLEKKEKKSEDNGKKED